MIFRSLASLSIRVAGAATSFGFQVLLARLLGPAHLGVYHTANSVAQLVAVVGRRGLDSVLVKHMSVAHGEGRDGDTRAIMAATLRVLFRTTAAVAALMIAVALLVGQQWLAHQDAVPTLVVFLLASLPLALAAAYGEALKSVGRPLHSAAVQGLALPALNLAAIAAVGSYVTTAAAGAWVFLSSASLALAIAMLSWRAASAGMTGAAGRCDAGAMTVEARPFFFAAMASMLAGTADLLILSVFGSPAEVGIYAVASRIAVLFTLVSLGINSVVAPQFARQASRKDAAALRALSRKACTLTAAAGLPILLVALLVPAWVMSLFGPEFGDGARVLQLVVAGRYVSLVSGPLGHLFQMAGRPQIERDLLFGTATALVALAVPLTVRYGATGTAVASCIAWAGLGAGRLVVAAYLFRRQRWQL